MQHVITDREVKAFRLEDSSLKSAVNAYFGKRPNDAYLHSPTPWGDLYELNKWGPVTTLLQPGRARIVDVKAEPLIIKEDRLENNSSVPADFEVGISHQVQRTSSHTWSNSQTVEFGLSLNAEYRFKGGSGIGGEGSFKYSYQWGQSHEQSESVTIGSTSGIVVTLQPHQAVIARLSATQGSLDICIDYEVFLFGRAAVNYNPTYKGHHFHGLDINEVKETGNLPAKCTITERITVGYYTNSKVELVDPGTNRVLVGHNMDAVPGSAAEQPIMLGVPSAATV